MFKGHGGYRKHNNESIKNNILDFSANINPLGYPEGVRKAVFENFSDILHYPDIDCSGLKKYIERKIGHFTNEIVVGNGSTELFYLAPRALKPAKGIILQPAFSEFPEALKCSGTEVIRYALNENDFSFQYKKYYFDDETVGMLFLCNPNNPTGLLIEKHALLSMIQQHPKVMFVIDEAFMDFVDEPERYTLINEAGTLENLIVVRSLTKFYGFPGLRIGYLVTHSDIAEKLMEYKEPWTVNTFAQYAAMVSMEDDEFVVASKAFIKNEKMYLYDELSKIHGLIPYKPAANFVFVKIGAEEINSVLLRKWMLECGIAIRDCSNFAGLNDRYFRVAVRTREENVKLIDVLKKMITEKNVSLCHR
ncbi:MAG: threonine-phosphate decarboxylase [Candidatus Kuenenia sp.]|nr:threonine-phosphate decarboxylase [Candidatus Kuenenia hertensis]